METTNYDLLMVSNIAESPEVMVMKCQETIALEFNITNTNPMTNIEFEISESFGQPDSLHFGVPMVNFGSAYQIADPLTRLVHFPEEKSNTGMSSVSRFL